MTMPHIRIGMVSIGLMVLSAGAVLGQDYPSKPIRIVAGAVGGGGDFMARQIAQGISGPLGQPVIVDNRIALVSAETVAKAQPDGYSLLVQGGTLWLIQFLQKPNFDVVRDFSTISLVSRNVNVLAVHPSVPANSVKELIALAKAKPGQLNYGSTVAGGNQHIGGELFKSLAGVDLVRVVYKGGSAATIGLVSGEVQVLVNDAGVLMPQAKAGKLRALAVTSITPSLMAPGLPTMVAAGLPGYEWIGTTGLYAPAKTPAAIIKRLNQEVVRAVNLPETKERLFSVGEEIVASSPEEFAATIRNDIVRLGKLIKDADIKAD
jgi:tripartite-type tricarboxylate transporter receptor subunit TctC